MAKQLDNLLPYFTCGPVVKGFGRGSKQLGCPTANFPQYVVDRLPADFPSGVYFGFASVNNGLVRNMVLSIGTNPFYHNPLKSIETHIIHEYRDDFYGALLKICILGFIRDQNSFASLDDLRTAINRDIESAQRELSKPQFLVVSQSTFFQENGEKAVLDNPEFLQRIFDDITNARGILDKSSL